MMKPSSVHIQRHTSRPRLLNGEPLNTKIQWYSPPRRPYSKLELIADRVVNFTGAILSWLLAVWLSFNSYAAGDPIITQIGFLLHGIGLITMLNCSALYHYMCWDWKLAERLFSLDHIGISSMIMGCYAPVMLACEAYKTLAFVWVLGVFGLATEMSKLLCCFKSAAVDDLSSETQNRTGEWTMMDCLNLVRYLLMGWAVLPILGSIAQKFPVSAVMTEIIGGLFYTGGVFFFIRGMEFHLAIWHTFVLVASLCFYSVNLFVLVGGLN